MKPVKRLRADNFKIAYIGDSRGWAWQLILMRDLHFLHLEQDLSCTVSLSDIDYNAEKE